MSRTNYEAVAGYFGHWLHRAQVSLLTGEIGQIAEGAQTVSSFKFAGRVLRWRSPENLQILTV